MKRSPDMAVRLVGAVFWLVALGGVSSCVVSFPLNRSPIGSIYRWLNGESVGEQMANDLAEDLLNNPELQPLQDWAIAMLERAHSGQLHVGENGQLPTHEIPPYIRQRWGQATVGIVTNANGVPVCIHVGWWWENGVRVGPTNFVQSRAPHWHLAPAKPGVYAYQFTRPE